MHSPQQEKHSHSVSARFGGNNLRTQGISQSTLRDEVAEYFEAGAVIAPGDVVVDVGANIGAFALAAAERTQGDVTIHCFEPAIPTFQLLQRNFRHNRLMHKTRHTANCLALTRPEMAGQERPFYFFKRLPTDSTYDLEAKHRDFEKWCQDHGRVLAAFLSKWVPLVGAPVGNILLKGIFFLCNRNNQFGVWLADRVAGLQIMTCRTDTLENWIRTHQIKHIDLLKMDVEGAEVDVLAGIGAAWSMIQQVAIETHNHSGRAEMIRDLLRKQGFRSIKDFKPVIAYTAEADNVLIIAHRNAIN